MPRPGPRPYECVRRAWHSDRHQPIRGSIIQQIFRVVNEAHSTATKKNKEWQEKLPIVVLRAEEIMYSKANSEAEYMNLETLWDRVNDAINTIIRRDESTETGELLPPCVEAALNLGCVPVRASRSQRHSNPRSYLSPRIQEPLSVSPRVLDKSSGERCPPLSPFHSGSQLNLARVATTTATTFPVSESNRPMTENSNITAPCIYPFPRENTLPDCNQLMVTDNNVQLNVGSIFPLYYGHQYQMNESQLISQVPKNINSNSIFVGKPISMPIAEPAEKGVLQNFFSCSSAEIASQRTAQADFGNTDEQSSGTQCDLSLRLGIFSNPCMNVERNSAQETEEVGSSSSQDRRKTSDFLWQKNEFCFFPRSTNDPFQSCSIKWFSEVEGQNSEANISKQEVPFSNNVEAGQSCWRPGFSPNQFIG